jgi:oligogalacturonide transporter
MQDKHQTTLKSKLGYGAGDMYAGGAFLLVGLLFLNFLTDVVGVAPKLAGAIFLIGKIWDAISDPLMGYISDRTSSKLGRRRFYFALGIIPVFLSFMLLWLDISGQDWVVFIYYTFAYIFFTTTFTMVMVPYNALLPNMVTDYSKRTSYNMYRMIFSSFSAIASGVFPMLIVNGATQKSTGYIIMGIVFGLLYSIPWIFVLLTTWENPIEQTVQSQSNSLNSLFNEFKESTQNKSFRNHAGFYVSSQTAADFLTTLFIYYLTYVLAREGEFSMVLGTLLIVQLISMPIHAKVAQKFNKGTPLKIGLSVWAVGLLISLFIDQNSPSYLIYVVAAMSGVGGSSAIFVPWSILPDISDVDELITGRRREGIYAGMSTLIRKMAQAVAVFVIGVYLDIIGYIPNITQTDDVILGIRLIFFIGPILFILLAIFFIARYNMTEHKHGVLMAEIAYRKENHKGSNNPETIEVCEALTGHNYENLATFK